MGVGGLRTKGYSKQSLKDRPLFSVITVVFNGQDTLESTILNVIKQTYENIEYIIVDGGSTDSTLDIICKYENAIDYWVSEQDSGIYDAMNKGIALATGDWINFMNAGDNFFDKNVIQQTFEKLISQNNTVYFLYGGADVYNGNGKFLSRLAPLEFTKRNLNMMATRTVCHQSIIISSKIIPTYSTKFALKGELDWYYNILKKIEKGQFIKLDFPICNYSLGGAGDVHFSQNLFERIRVLRKHNHFLTFIFYLAFIIISLLFLLKRKVTAKFSESS